MVKSQVMEASRNEGRQEFLLNALAAKAKGEVPPDLADKVRSCTDPAKLHAWFDLALKSRSLASFRKAAGL